MKDNTCNYSDTFQPYIGDYDKFEYDIKLADGTIVENCYPNAGKFNSISDLHDGQKFEEKLVVEIRFSQRPRFMLNDEVSEAKPDPEYIERMNSVTNNIETKHLNHDENYLKINSVDWVNYHYNGSSIKVPQYIRPEPKINRNDICPKCDSGKKYKKCCITLNS